MKIKARIRNDDTTGLNCVTCESLVERLRSAKVGLKNIVGGMSAAGSAGVCTLETDFAEFEQCMSVVDNLLTAISDPKSCADQFHHRKIFDFFQEFSEESGSIVHLSDFFIVGGARCGSSWMRWNLGQHPNILMLRGEPKWLSANLHHPVLSNFEKYFPFRFNFSHPERFSRVFYNYCSMGEKSPDYHTVSDLRMSMIDFLFPESRFVLLTRDPVDRMWSHLKHQFRAQQAEFLDFLAGGQGHSPDCGGEVWDWVLRFHREGLFARSISRWRTAFGEKRVVVVPYEDIASDGASVLARVCVHAGVSAPPDWLARQGASARRNTTDAIEMPPFLRKYLEDAYGEERCALSTLSGPP